MTLDRPIVLKIGVLSSTASPYSTYLGTLVHLQESRPHNVSQFTFPSSFFFCQANMVLFAILLRVIFRKIATKNRNNHLEITK